MLGPSSLAQLIAKNRPGRWCHGARQTPTNVAFSGRHLGTFPDPHPPPDLIIASKDGIFYIPLHGQGLARPILTQHVLKDPLPEARGTGPACLPCCNLSKDVQNLDFQVEFEISATWRMFWTLYLTVLAEKARCSAPHFGMGEV